MTPANPYLYASLSKNFLSLKLNSPFLSLSLSLHIFICLSPIHFLSLSFFVSRISHLSPKFLYPNIAHLFLYLYLNLMKFALWSKNKIGKLLNSTGYFVFFSFFFCLFLGLHFCGYLFICVNLSWPRWVFMLILVWMLLDCLDIGFLGCDCWC